MTADRLARLRAALRAAAVDALVVTHPPNIQYLTGLRASAGAVLLTTDRCVLVVDFRYAEAARSCAAALAGGEVTLAAGALDDAIAEAVGTGAPTRVGIEADHLPVARFNRLAGLLASSAPLPMDDSVPAVLVSTQRLVERLRAVKDAEECATLREAARRLSAVARRLREWVEPGRTEAEVAASIDAALRDAGFERTAFDTIVASGPNSALPHARPTGRRLSRGDGVVLDFGGVYDGYCVDLTRTLHLGPPSDAFRRIFDAVREAHAAALQAVVPGALPAEIDAAARGVLERHGLGEAFGHGTGHGLGVEVHEEPRISRHAPAGEPIVPGMVFTIEPGAYVPGSGGVRIEDDVLVREDGCELLTHVPIEF
ncbi:MAG TPA: Xaa-Pro peptidase family protein [Vicinamibacterales bacterium]|nr:Xaa-Pro peptidase family protein [Vicinamibacterales bacterium]